MELVNVVPPAPPSPRTAQVRGDFLCWKTVQNRVCRGHLGAVIQMRVDIRGCGNVAMPQPFLDVFQADTVRIKRSETMANGKCTCCLIVIRRLSPRKYLTEYRHFCNQGKTHTLVQQTSHSAENYIAQIVVGHSNGNLQMIKCIGSAIRISRMLHHALHHHIIRRI